MIVCQGLSYHYPTSAAPVLQDLDFRIETGEFVVLAGASGSGKSTLCRIFNGLIPHLHGGELHGAVHVAGLDPRLTPTYQLSRITGLVLQRPDAQCLATTVARDLALGPAWQGLDRAVVLERAQAAAAAMAIVDLLQRAPHTLSSGEQQQVALAGVLAMHPQILVLDEPFAFLDAAGAATLRAQLRRLHAAGLTLIVAEHRLEEVTDLASRMLVLQHGRLVADATPQAILAGDVAAWDLEPPGAESYPVSAASSAPEAETVVAWDEVWYHHAQSPPVLRGASLHIDTGTVTALLGANGAGKSTLLRHGNGLLRAQRGTVRVLNRPIGRQPVAALASTVGLVMQQPLHMLFAPTVRAELAAGPRALNRDDPAWMEQLIVQFGLEPLLERPPQRLSAGEQRRVALAAVLATRPQALLLDEPTAGQDAPARARLRALLADCAAQGLAILVATHDPRWASTLCSHWALLTAGQIVLDAPACLIARYRTAAQIVPHTGVVVA